MSKPKDGASAPDTAPHQSESPVSGASAGSGAAKGHTSQGLSKSKPGGAKGGNKNGNTASLSSEPQAPASGEGVNERKRRSKRRSRRNRRRGKGAPAGNPPVANANVVNANAASSSASTNPVEQTTATNDARPPAPKITEDGAYAALDLGTNNCRLLVAIPQRPGQFRVIDAFSRIVRLGEGLGHTNMLSQGAMDRALGALEVCRNKLDSRPIRRMRLIATEACRAALNGQEFLDRVHDRTGLELEIVDRETEARLAVSGCSSLVDREAKSTVLFDIGGGSSEIAVIRLGEGASRRLADNIVAWTSLPVGVVTMAEKFGGRQVNAETFGAMKAYALDLLEDFKDRHILDTGADTAFHLIGTSGTVTTLAGIHLGLPRYDRRRVDGLWMASSEVSAINEQLLGWSFEERVANPCIGADRADLVLAGCAILEAIRDTWPAGRLRVADRGLREGILTEMMNEDGVWRRHRYRRNNRSRRSSGGEDKGKA